jgi:hypothetical protein
MSMSTNAGWSISSTAIAASTSWSSRRADQGRIRLPRHLDDTDGKA